MNATDFFAIKKDNLEEGSKKEIEIQGNKILVAKVRGSIYAVDAVCPHYKAPLVKGALCGTKLYCPWHHSAFDITTGKLCEPPAIDGLATYEVIESGDDIYIKLPAKNTTKSNKRKINNDKTFVIIGGGAAGLMAAQTLRQQGFDGKLLLITKETELPYDRTALSKNFLSGKKKEEELPLRKPDFFEQNNIEVIRGKEVTKADVATKRITFSDDSALSYDSLLIATGSEPLKPDVEGAHKKNVFTLRSKGDAKQILEEAKTAKKVCIVGASFIAIETAASLITIGLEVTVIAKEKLPFEKNIGEEIGRMFYNMHIEKGVVIKTEAEVEKIEGREQAETVILKSGERIETDFVIVGIGVKPKTDFVQGLKLNEEDNSIPVDEHLKAATDVYAAGDVAQYMDLHTNKPVRIEHWRVAQQHGCIAAMNMLNGEHSVKETVPFFWTNQFDKRLSYVGHAEDWDEIVVDGDIVAQSFMSFYIKDNKVLAVASMNRDEESNKIEELMLKNVSISLDKMKQELQK